MTDIRSVYLGQFTNEHAVEIGDRLDAADIGWWAKSPGWLSGVFFADSWGVRLFVRSDRLDEAKEIAREVAPEAL